jgi:hypothetical protein
MFAALNSIGLYVFWGFIGISIMAPLFFVGNVVQVAKTADTYHFRGYYKLKKEHHKREVRRYGSVVFLTSIIVIGFIVLP